MDKGQVSTPGLVQGPIFDSKNPAVYLVVVLSKHAAVGKNPCWGSAVDGGGLHERSLWALLSSLELLHPRDQEERL